MQQQDTYKKPHCQVRAIFKFWYSIRANVHFPFFSFEKLVQGEYPLTAKEVVLPTDPKFKMPKVSKAALDLLDFEKEVDEKNDEKEFIGSYFIYDDLF